MLVNELIEALRKLPQDLPVVLELNKKFHPEVIEVFEDCLDDGTQAVFIVWFPQIPVDVIDSSQ